MNIGRILSNSLKKYHAPRDIKAYVTSHNESKINMGCSKNIVSGWINMDIQPPSGAVYADMGRSWPFYTGTIDAILSEHVIEHVSKAVGVVMLAESYRVLKPGGVIRVVTPDLEFVSRLIGENSRESITYLEGIKSLLGISDLSACDAVNLLFYDHGHMYLYSPAELRQAFEQAGFIDIVHTRAGQPHDPIFSNAEGHGRAIGEEINSIEAFALEARKQE